MDFKGQVAISTGAASGMGLLFAENFADLGNVLHNSDVEAGIDVGFGDFYRIGSAPVTETPTAVLLFADKTEFASVLEVIEEVEHLREEFRK